ncbi:unnamed protein product [Parajaminaea phylloscopi]
MSEFEAARGSAGRIWSRFTSLLPWSWSQTKKSPSRVTSAPMEENTWSDTWFFAAQPLHFPTERGWPPPLPGIVSEYVSTAGSPTWTRPKRSSEAPYRKLEARPPRDMAALALDVHRYSLPPRKDTVQLEAGSPPKQVWRPGFGLEESIRPEDQAWSLEKFSRLEYVGDAVAREIASRIIFDAFPDVGSGGVSTATSHLVTNDTFGFLYQLSGMGHMRERLARELLRDAVVKRLEAESRESDQSAEASEPAESAPSPGPDDLFLDLTSLDRYRKADCFEAYLAYIRIAHGPEVAENWFAALIQPWVDRIAKETSWPGLRTMSAAGILRRKQDEIRLEGERRAKAEAAQKHFARFGPMAFTASSLVRRLMNREARQRGDGRARSRKDS